MTIRILIGHVLTQLAEIPSDSIHCCVTSPPYYGLRDYGIEPQVWGGSPACRHEWGEKVTRKQLSGGNNKWSESRYLRDGASVVPASKSESCRQCNAWRGSLGLEPTLELYLEHMLTVCREIHRVLRKDGTLWLNIGDSYASNAPGTRNGSGTGLQSKPNQISYRPDYRGRSIKPKDLMLIPARLAIALQSDGWFVRSEIVWAKDAPMPESVTDRPTSAHEKIFLLTKSARYYYDAEAVKEDAVLAGETVTFTSPSRTARAFYAKPSGNEANGAVLSYSQRNLRNVWRLSPSPFPDAHFATFPPELPRRCIKAGTKPGDTVLDPFAGSGTTLLVADQLQRNAIGIELNAAYANMAHQRIQQDAPLFATVLTSNNDAVTDQPLLPL